MINNILLCIFGLGTVVGVINVMLGLIGVMERPQSPLNIKNLLAGMVTLLVMTQVPIRTEPQINYNVEVCEEKQGDETQYYIVAGSNRNRIDRVKFYTPTESNDKYYLKYTTYTNILGKRDTTAPTLYVPREMQKVD